MSEPVHPADDVRELIGDMLDTMKAREGVGLAAIQIAVPLRVIVVNVRNHPMIMINPEIVKSTGSVSIVEGCLSFPGRKVKVKRAKRVKVIALDHNKIERVHKLSGMDAICVQHEIDHLDGVCIVDKER